MSNDLAVPQPGAEPAEKIPVEPAQPTGEENTPEPPQEKTAEEIEAEKAEAERKAEKRRERRERRDFFELKGELQAKVDFLDRQIQRLQQASPTAEDTQEIKDIGSLREQLFEEFRREERARAIEQKKESIFSQAGVSRTEFSENVETVTPQMAEAIIDSDIAAKIGKYLNENPEEAQRIAKMPVSRHGAEIGKLELNLATQTPVKKSGASEYRPDMTDEEYNKWVEAQRKSYKG